MKKLYTALLISLLLPYIATATCAGVSSVTATATPNPVCAGATLTLTGSASGTSTYSWAGPGSFTAAVKSPTLTATTSSAGVYTFTAYNSGGCATSVTTASVSVTADAITGATGECAGQTTTLSDPLTGGFWTSSNPAIASVSSSGVVTGRVSGSVIISYASTCGLETIANNVKPLPGAIAGRDSACVGGTSSLSDDISGGTWTSSDTFVAKVVYGPSGSTIVSGISSGVSVGVSLITYTLNTGCYITVPFKVIPRPTIIRGDSTACPGQITSLSDSVTGGRWSSANASIASVNAAGVVTGIRPDSVAITYTILPGCFISKEILVNHLPAHLSPSRLLCSGFSDSLSDDSLHGSWTTSDPSIATVSSTGVVEAISGGSAIITYTLPTGCYTTDTQRVRTSPAPIITYNSGDGTFSTGSGYVSYQWYQGPGPTTDTMLIPDAVSYRLAALYNEYYAVIVTDSFGCHGTSLAYDMTAVSVANINNDHVITIYPNPFSNTLYISSSIPVNVIICDLTGNTLIETQSATQIDISRLPSGAYIVSLTGKYGNILGTQRFIKQ